MNKDAINNHPFIKSYLATLKGRSSCIINLETHFVKEIFIEDGLVSKIRFSAPTVRIEGLPKLPEDGAIVSVSDCDEAAFKILHLVLTERYRSFVIDTVSRRLEAVGEQEDKKDTVLQSVLVAAPGKTFETSSFPHQQDLSRMYSFLADRYTVFHESADGEKFTIVNNVTGKSVDLDLSMLS